MIIIDKMRNYFRSLTNNKGFTLIELLVVIGILGILAAVVLTAINPLEQFARSRDAGRAQTITSLGHALEAYYTSLQVYPVQNGTWQTTTGLVQGGEIAAPATNPTYSNGAAACTSNIQLGYCYSQPATTPPSTVVYAHGESTNYRIKAGTLAAPCPVASTWIVWSSFDGRTGLLCQAGQPAATGASLGLISL
jgi:prepilin-type N-terminal cleavage/methylation domain-containing protein